MTVARAMTQQITRVIRAAELDVAAPFNGRVPIDDAANQGSWWGRFSAWVHGGLDVLGFASGLGEVADSTSRTGGRVAHGRMGLFWMRSWTRCWVSAPGPIIPRCSCISPGRLAMKTVTEESNSATICAEIPEDDNGLAYGSISGGCS